ncbi:hypothetical protein ACLESD_20840 [Pyxidicoccus sp. 3LFB2]
MSFNRFYDLFLQNTLKGQRFRIQLSSGSVMEGVPTAGSIASPLDPNVAFSFHASDGQSYLIPFRDLVNANTLT